MHTYWEGFENLVKPFLKRFYFAHDPRIHNVQKNCSPELNSLTPIPYWFLFVYFLRQTCYISEVSLRLGSASASRVVKL